MKVTKLEMEGLKLIELDVYNDHRGFFCERFNSARFQEHGLPTDLLQVNHSRSRPTVLRGLHYQKDPLQAKLVGVTRGRIWDVAVDLRTTSPTFGQSQGMELSDTNGKLLWIPAGFAHGFCVTGDDDADVLYMVDALYAPHTEGGIFWADPGLAIEWPIRRPIVSRKDEELPSFAEYCESRQRQLVSIER